MTPTKPPLYYHQNGTATSPPSALGGIDHTAALNGVGSNNGGMSAAGSAAAGIMERRVSYQSLLDKAQQFSMFAVNHVEEVREALRNTADKTNFTSDDNGFGGRNSDEISSAFDELAAAYEKLSSAKWNSARIEYEEIHRLESGLKLKYPNDGGLPLASGGLKPTNAIDGSTTKVVKMANETDSGSVRGLKIDHPWQEQDDNDPSKWVSNHFLNSAIEDEDEAGDTFPAVTNGQPALPSFPPGFKRSESLDADDHHTADRSAYTKNTMRSYTDVSEVSSLHTNHDSNDEDDDSYSDSSSSSSEEDLPPLENFDYVYKGGFVAKVSDGKETKGVVPKKVKHVLVDPSVKSIEDGAFQSCDKLESITIPSTCESVGDNSFRKCAKLKSVTFLTKMPKVPGEPRSSKLRSIGEWSFFNCSSLLVVKLPHGLESIGERAFQRCSAVLILELPKTLMSVGDYAFIGTPRETKLAYDRWERNHSK